MIEVSVITTVFDTITLLVSSFFLVKCLKNIKKGIRYLLCLIIFAIYIVPLYIDYFYMMPEYPTYCNGFIISRGDDLTNIVYDFFFLFLQYFLLFRKNKVSELDYDTSFTLQSNCRTLLYIGMAFAPLVVIVFIQQPFMLYTFGWRELGLMDPPRFYDQAEQFCYFSSSCALLLFFEKRKKTSQNILQKIIALAFLYVSLSIQGKRAILFFVMICICILLYFELLDRLKNNKSWKVFILYISVLGAVAVVYMITISLEVHVARGVGLEEDTNKIVTTQRVDFFRDDRVRTAIYSELNPHELPILPHRGQTIIPDIFGMVPINWLRDRIGIGRKIYQTYFTCALSGESINSSTVMRDSNWMTVTFIAEIISNFSLFLAFFIIPFVCLKTANIVEKLKYPFNILTVFIFVMLNLFDTTYVIVFIEFTVIFYLFLKPRKVIKN